MTITEVNLAIARLKAGSSPDADGFTCQWYKVLRDKLMPTLMRVYNWVFKEQEMPCQSFASSLRKAKRERNVKATVANKTLSSSGSVRSCVWTKGQHHGLSDEADAEVQKAAVHWVAT